MSEVGPHSRPHVLAKLDGRTREARLMRSVREDLINHIGGKPTVTQSALIERAAMLTLHISLMDEKALASMGAPLSERDSREYLAWSNALVKIMHSLGVEPAKQSDKPKGPSLSDIIGQRVAA